jgi:uncharacterized protein YukE
MTELGWADNPKELIPGNSEEIRDLVRSLRSYGHALEDVGKGLRTVDDGGWQGKAADAFRARYEGEPKRWLEASDAFLDAADALEGYADTLDWAQAQAAEAIKLWNDGDLRTQAAAVSDPSLLMGHSQDQLASLLGTQTLPIVAGDPGAELKLKGREVLARARHQLSDAGDGAALTVGNARDLAPPNPTFWQNVQGFFGGAVDEVKSTASLLDPRNWGTVATGISQLIELATHDPGAAARYAFDYETMRDDPSRWIGGMLAGSLLGKGVGRFGKVGKFGKLSDRLGEHVFYGHSRPGRIVGYHHRPSGADAGEFRVVEIRKPPDRNGVYEARVEGPTEEGYIGYKNSTFFPDSWSQGEVQDAIQQAFENRQPVYDRAGAPLPHKWQGMYNGVRVEGMYQYGTDFNSGKLYDVATAYPKYGG